MQKCIGCFIRSMFPWYFGYLNAKWDRVNFEAPLPVWQVHYMVAIMKLIVPKHPKLAEYSLRYCNDYWNVLCSDTWPDDRVGGDGLWKIIWQKWKKNSIRIGAPTCILAAFTAFYPGIISVQPLQPLAKYWNSPGKMGNDCIIFGAFILWEPISLLCSSWYERYLLRFPFWKHWNMRVPCAALALDVTKSKSGTIQAEVVSTMAICGSIITNLIATTGAVLVGSAVVAVLPASL